MLSRRHFVASLAGVLLFGVVAAPKPDPPKPRSSKPKLTLDATGATTARAG